MKSQPVDWSAGLAKLPRDRFASINGGKDTGTLITRPLNFHGSKLHVNAAVALGAGFAWISRPAMENQSRVTTRPTACRSMGTASTCP